MTQTDFLSNPELCTKEFLKAILPVVPEGTDEKKIKDLVSGDWKFGTTINALHTDALPLACLPEPGRTEFLKIAIEQAVKRHDHTESEEVLHYCGLLFGILSQDEQFCIEIVSEDPWLLPYVKEQTEKICYEAVRRDGRVIRFVKDQTEDLCLTAVSQCGKALQYVKKQNTKIIVTAIKQDSIAIKFVDPEL